MSNPLIFASLTAFASSVVVSLSIHGGNRLGEFSKFALTTIGFFGFFLSGVVLNYGEARLKIDAVYIERAKAEMADEIDLLFQSGPVDDED